MDDLTAKIRRQMSALESKKRLRTLRNIEAVQGTQITFDGKNHINFASNNYLGLAQHPQMIAAAAKAAHDWGTGSGASRLITGSLSIHHQLENEIAAFKGTDAALVFNSGYQLNTTLLPALAGPHDVIFSDSLNHASLIDGARLSKAKKIIYQHINYHELEEKLEVESKSRSKDSVFLIVTESVFSMDGDQTDIEKLMSIAEQYSAQIYLDDAHATGVLGLEGRGLVAASNVNPKHPLLIQMGTFSKALGSFGAYVAGSRELCDYLISSARGFIFSTALPPAVIGANREALRICVQDNERRDKLRRNISKMSSSFGLFFSLYPVAVVPVTRTPIFPLIMGMEDVVLKNQEQLREKGIWATAIRPPTIPEGASRIRFTITAEHTPEQINSLFHVFEDLWVP